MNLNMSKAWSSILNQVLFSIHWNFKKELWWKVFSSKIEIFRQLNHQPVDFNGWGYDFLSGLFELCGRCIFCPFGDFTDHDFRNPSSSSANLFWEFLADFQHHRVLKYTMISFAKFLLYSIVSLSLQAVLFLVISSIYLSD